MNRYLIIGYGNPLRGDDGLGWEAARRLEKHPLGEAVSILALHQLAPEVAEHLSRSSHALFIDCREGFIAGQIQWKTLKPGKKPLPLSAFDHILHPAALLRYAVDLYGAAPEAHLISVTGTSFGYGECLSPEVSTAIDHMIIQIKDWITQRERKYSHA